MFQEALKEYFTQISQDVQTSLIFLEDSDKNQPTRKHRETAKLL